MEISRPHGCTHTDRVSRIIIPSNDYLVILRSDLSNVVVIIAVWRAEKCRRVTRNFLESGFFGILHIYIFLIREKLFIRTP